VKERSLLSRKQWRYKLRQQFKHVERGYTKLVGLVFLCSMVLLVSACTLFPGPSQTGSTDPTNVAQYNTTPTQNSFVSPTTSSSSSFTFQTAGCPSTLSLNWDRLIGTKANVTKVWKVYCGTIENGGLVALIDVRYYEADAKIDFYVYDNLLGTPARRFAIQGLVQGDAKISPTNTIITAQNAGNDPIGPNLFKEYQWNGSTYAQILFPGIYPYMTHYQAEQVQATVSTTLAQATTTPKTQIPWQLSAFPVVSRMAQDIFHWNGSLIKTAIVPPYNAQSAIYNIQVTNYGPGGGGFVANLFRLDSNLASNIFEVKQVTSIDGTVLLSSPASGTQVSSPVKVTGSYQSTGTILGQVVLYDDTFVKVGDTGAIHGSAPSGSVTFAPTVSYHLAVRGLQEGLVAFYVTNQNNINASNQVVLVKVLFSA